MAYTTIDDPSIYFNTLAYAGNGSSGRSVTGVGFQPDWVWIKNRSDGDPNKIFDSVRGVSKSIKSNSTDAEVSTEENGYVSAFNSDGFTLTLPAKLFGFSPTGPVGNPLASLIYFLNDFIILVLIVRKGERISPLPFYLGRLKILLIS